MDPNSCLSPAASTITACGRSQSREGHGPNPCLWAGVASTLFHRRFHAREILRSFSASLTPTSGVSRYPGRIRRPVQPLHLIPQVSLTTSLNSLPTARRSPLPPIAPVIPRSGSATTMVLTGSSLRHFQVRTVPVPIGLRTASRSLSPPIRRGRLSSMSSAPREAKPGD